MVHDDILNYDLNGKTAFITGASSGLGERFAYALSAAGARVILASRRVDKLQNLAKELGNAKAIQMDVADKEAAARVFAELEEDNEKIDICINNAGIAALTQIFAEDQDDYFESIIQTNLIGVWLVTKAVANHMKNHNIYGSIINIASVNGDKVPAAGGSAYSVSKAAVIHLTKTLVEELSPHKIRINCISPGWFKTPLTEQSVAGAVVNIPVGFVANPDDLDGLILYLSSNKVSRYVTGANFTIDGGMSWRGLSW